MAQLGVVARLSSVGPNGVRTVGYSTGFFVIASPWGIDGVPTLVGSFTEFLTLFGGLNKLATVTADNSADTYSVETTDFVVQGYYALKSFFGEQGAVPTGPAYVVRVVKAAGGATAALRTFSDGGANNTTITSKWKGIHGGTTQIDIVTPSPRKGSSYAQITVTHARSGIVEVWEIANAQDAAEASRKSQLVTITLPAGGQLPQSASGKKLYNGTPGTADAYDATDANIVGTTSSANVKTGLQCFNDFRFGTGRVAVPGKYSSTIRSGLKTHCETYYRYAVFGASSGLVVNTVGADISGVTTNFGAYWWPQVRVADDNSDTGGTVLIDNVGPLMGLWTRMDGEYRGPHKSPAGTTHAFRTVIDVERATGTGDELCDDTYSNTLADSGINTIRVKNNSIVSWGLRSLSTDLRYLQVNSGMVVAVVYLTGLLNLQPYAFEPIDPFGELFAEVRGTMKELLYALRDVGALYGDIPGSTAKATDAYSVICDRSNNPPVQVDAGKLQCDVAIAPTKNAELVLLNIGVARTGQIPLQ